MPQLYMITKTGEAETITSHYLFALGAYRAMYIINWAFRFWVEDFYDWIAIVAGCVQTALYIDFFYLYITKGNFLKFLTSSVILLVFFCFPVMKGKELKLPA